MRLSQLKNQQGFTLFELMIVLAILAILSAIALIYFNDLLARGRDASVVADAVNLIKVVNNDFLDNKSVHYNILTANGRGVGAADEDDNPADPVYTLSSGVRIVFPSPCISSSDDTVDGYFNAYLYHEIGTEDPTDVTGLGFFRKVVEITIDENAGVSTYFPY